jgi:hypothetical protein
MTPTKLTDARLAEIRKSIAFDIGKCLCYKCCQLRALSDHIAALASEQENTIAQLRDELAAAKIPKLFPIQRDYDRRNPPKPHPTKIPWSIAELAYSVYSHRYGRDQSLERLAQRGGFGAGEMDMFLPDWRERCSEIASLTARCEAAEKERDRLKGLCAEQYEDREFIRRTRGV